VFVQLHQLAERDREPTPELEQHAERRVDLAPLDRGDEQRAVWEEVAMSVRWTVSCSVP
jgi:hypothetical protein